VSRKKKLNITIEYLLPGSESWEKLKITQKEYFDQKYILKGKDRIASLPLFQDDWKYIESEVRPIATKTVIADPNLALRNEYLQTNWNGGESTFCEVTE
jgi:hypothetical protein